MRAYMCAKVHVCVCRHLFVRSFLQMTSSLCDLVKLDVKNEKIRIFPSSINTDFSAKRNWTFFLNIKIIYEKQALGFWLDA